jgi:membrane protein insertase Oxa1/YidC/SpoIIIJ|tara:strand:+ start:231 stop:464 length:234 start_codon:yes stop_codon:yes gene_type:complete
MEIDAMLFWNIILTMVVVPFGWAFNKMFQEVKRIQILLNKTREEYAHKNDVKDDVHELMDAMRRLEDKLDKILMGSK